ncbi:phosphatase [Phytopseudomonas punonensis]|uniref:phosphoglycolate phosphatase n=1 Tax=Phytopseudomonas punonensis TaxID=1220495 RepID=A0A1M7MFA9_9GAMM|nr:phosphatase [Pseudomonas punonensis]SHM89471.1 Beta-phosphoglucomutase, HAD superfamily [Pseudomonas punonensis]
MPQPAFYPASASFTAVLFGLSGCLVDFGARSSSTSGPRHLALVREHGNAARQPATTQELDSFAEPTPGALSTLRSLHDQRVPCAWLDELPEAVSHKLASRLPDWLAASPACTQRAWPAPDACWQALAALQIERLEGCVLVSGEPRLIQAGLNAGLWTVGLAACGSLAGHALADWQVLDEVQRERLRADATLALYRIGAHSVIDQLTDLPACLEHMHIRRSKGEKP